MSAMLLLLLCLVAWVVLRNTGRLSDAAPATLNVYLINLALPSLPLVHLHRTELTPELLASAAGAWLMLGLAALFFAFAARLMNSAQPRPVR